MRRKGGVPPIVTVLVTIAAIVAAALVAWFLWVSTRSAATTPILEVTAAYASCSGTSCNVAVTVRNVGATDVRLTGTPSANVAGQSLSCTCSPSCPSTIPRGGTVAITCSGAPVTLPDGAEGYIVIANQTLGFKVVRP